MLFTTVKFNVLTFVAFMIYLRTWKKILTK